MLLTAGSLAPQFDQDYTKGLQKALNEKVGTSIAADGDFGPTSQGVLKQYQMKAGIPATGIYDAATQALLNSFILGKYLQSQDYAAAAQEIAVLTSTIRTVCQVETSGSGFLPDGRCIILFERHIFLQQLQKVMPQTQINSLMAKGNSDIINATPGGYVGGAGEYPRFNRAFAINSDAAMMACSWGLFQIMGEHYDWAGYSDVVAFVNDMRVSEDKHIQAFLGFVKNTSNGQMVKLLQTKDWLNFARQYNGSSEANTNPPYHTRLANDFAALFPIYG